MHPAPRPRVPRVVLTERLYHEVPVLMLPRIASRSLWCALLLALGALQPAARAQPATPPKKTRNVVLIVSDGLRWQEIFTGADPILLNEKNGGIWDKEPDLRR